MQNMASSSRTIIDYFAEAVAHRGKEQALGFIREGVLHWRTWSEVASDVTRVANVIRSAGVSSGDRVAQVSENRYEWIITDLAVHLVGAVHVPIHVTLSGEQIAEQIADCGARMVFVSCDELLHKFVSLIDNRLPVVVHETQGEPQPVDSDFADFPRASVNWENVATILYTSGTTGRPRGVMLTHANLASNARGASEMFGGGHEQTRLCILPLSHIFARTCDLYTWVYRGSQLVLAENRETLERDCKLAKPTAISAVPFLYQRVADRLRNDPATDNPESLRSFFGGRMEHLTSGGAPLAPDVEAWFAERELPILQGYGLTESSPVISLSTPHSRRFGAVGRPLAGIEVRIAEDGEILVRGPNVMLGYWRNEEATSQTIRDGWLHTGDLGELDADGFLYIRGRKKELIVLSTGKKVFPGRIESLLTASPLIEQAAVFGDGLPTLVALIVPAARHKDGGETREELSQIIEAEIARCLASAAHEEQVRRFVLLDRPFSLDHGELTAKMSLRRDVIARNFAADLAAMGAGPPTTSRLHSSR